MKAGPTQLPYPPPFLSLPPKKTTSTNVENNPVVKKALCPPLNKDTAIPPLGQALSPSSHQTLCIFPQEWSRSWKTPRRSPKFSKAQWATRAPLKMKCWITGSKRNALLKKRWAPASPYSEGSWQVIMIQQNNDMFLRGLPVPCLLTHWWSTFLLSSLGFKQFPLVTQQICAKQRCSLRPRWAFASPLIIRPALHKIWFCEITC